MKLQFLFLDKINQRHEVDAEKYNFKLEVTNETGGVDKPSDQFFTLSTSAKFRSNEFMYFKDGNKYTSKPGTIQELKVQDASDTILINDDT